MATTKRKSRIFEEMHETAQGLYETGIISKRRMDELEALCKPESIMNTMKRSAK